MSEQIETRETTPTPRCDHENCDRPAAWAVDMSGYDSLRSPPYRFWDEHYCDEHLPPAARDKIVEWARGS